MAERDRLVFQTMATPIAWNLAGDYRATPDGDCTPVLNTQRATGSQRAAALTLERVRTSISSGVHICQAQTSAAAVTCLPLGTDRLGVRAPQGEAMTLAAQEPGTRRTSGSLPSWT